jgi:hypothetical protein
MMGLRKAAEHPEIWFDSCKAVLPHLQQWQQQQQPAAATAAWCR